MRFAKALLSVIDSLKHKKHTTAYILKVICDMLEAYIGK